MRILILVDCYYPTPKSSAKLVHDLALELRSGGHEVIVGTPGAENRDDLELSCEEGVTIARFKTGRIKGVSRALRAIREAGLSAALWRKGKEFFRERPCDLIIFYSPTIFFGALVKRLKSLWRCHSYLILRDIFPQWTLDAGVLKEGVIYRFFLMKEMEQYAAADFIGVQSPANLKYLAERLPDHDRRLEVLYNWTTLDEGGLPVSGYRSRLKLQDRVVFFYGGNIGTAQDVENIGRLAWNLRSEPHIYFLLVGEGSEFERFKTGISEMGLSNVGMLPSVPQREYLSMLSEFDVGLVSLDRRLKTQNFPGKILGYAYFYKPILGSFNPGNDLKELLEECEAGLCSLNGDDHKFRADALALANDRSLRERIGQNARRLLEEKFSVTSAARQILSHFQHHLPASTGSAPAGGPHGQKWQAAGIKA